jgi:hypothetical protein
VQALPRSVIRSGNVIEVRSGVSDLLHGSSPQERPDVVVVDTPGELQGFRLCILTFIPSIRREWVAPTPFHS